MQKKFNQSGKKATHKPILFIVYFTKNLFLFSQRLYVQCGCERGKRATFLTVTVFVDEKKIPSSLALVKEHSFHFGSNI